MVVYDVCVLCRLCWKSVDVRFCWAWRMIRRKCGLFTVFCSGIEWNWSTVPSFTDSVGELVASVYTTVTSSFSAWQYPRARRRRLFRIAIHVFIGVAHENKNITSVRSVIRRVSTCPLSYVCFCNVSWFFDKKRYCTWLVFVGVFFYVCTRVQYCVTQKLQYC